MNYLFVVAHPDDEVLGAGATIHKLIKDGNRVAVCTMANHAAARANISDTLASDQNSAMSILGVTNVYHGDFPNIKKNTEPHLNLVQFIESCIEDFNAESIFTHHPSDTNNDHVMTSYAAQAASRLFQRKSGIVFIYIVTSPFCLIAVLGIEFSDLGPVFYIARRIEKNNCKFKMFKFRSMKIAKNADESNFKADTNRIFPFGRFIRATKIDELPQLLNILFGERVIIETTKKNADFSRVVKVNSISL